LRRKLRALTGQTIVEYIRNHRLEMAAERLSTKAATVSEIAYQVGFESLSYFSKVFLERYGKKPSEWP
jgi:AraC-like DNA-binding protein